MKARIIVATHSDLFNKQMAGSFRKDLYYRLCTHQVEIPPLRKRLDDVPVLLDHFLEKACEEMNKAKPEITKKLISLLMSYHFPGNVRELELMVYNALTINKGRVLALEPFREAISRGSTQFYYNNDDYEFVHDNPFETIENLPTLAQATKLLINEAMKRSNGNQTVASRTLGISQPALSKRLKQQTNGLSILK